MPVAAVSPVREGALEWTGEYRGLRIGEESSRVAFAAIEGLLDAPGLRTADRAALQRHGTVRGLDWLDARTVTLTLEVYARSTGELGRELDAVTTAFAPAAPPAPFRFRLPGVAGGGLREIRAVVRRRSIPIDVPYAHGHVAMVTVELYAADPLIYDPVVQSGSTGLPAPPSGGLSFPLRFPFSFGTAQIPGTVTCVNRGNFPAYPHFRIYGPVSLPRIVDMSTGDALELHTDVPAGQFVDVDTRTHETLLNGTAPRFYAVGGNTAWPTIRPGLSQLGFRSPFTAADSGAVLHIAWHSVWV
ncbi:hypothetical protein GCM10012275_19220 [Longimycelium tulufanense]|uniref:Siphovirus-type tail component C-terminal domain-containing protein n=1 Tax=Longimycelium tulufanense TaxID=907463 RepID=A0A8J3C7H6_9PSEU|nr:phage tail domain-containing protein [Longimycelium tulufanense]GGM48390.1 hypothetical protein GCM10012275_19220 [Longimycelium tulufanense]